MEMLDPEDSLMVNSIALGKSTENDIFQATKSGLQARQEQLNLISAIQMNQSVNDDHYNDVIDECNGADEKVSLFFESIMVNDLTAVKNTVSANPLIVYEVNDEMETSMHIAVRSQHWEVLEWLMDQEFGCALAKSKNMRGQTPFDLAIASKCNPKILCLF